MPLRRCCCLWVLGRPPAAARCHACLRRIILENSGVAEPQNIRDQFNDAILDGVPLMKRVYLDTLVTGGLSLAAAERGSCHSIG